MGRYYAEDLSNLSNLSNVFGRVVSLNVINQQDREEYR